MFVQSQEQLHIENRLLAKLPSHELDLLRPHLELVTLLPAQPLILPDEPIPYLYFPVSALASLVSVMHDGTAIEASAIGREGMVGISVLLDAGTTPMQTLTQIAGTAIRVKAEIMKAAFDTREAVRRLLHRYIHTLIVVTSQSAACNRRHVVEARLCRWLLLSSDGVGADEFVLAQEFLATMLGVPRSVVVESALKLQRENMIRYDQNRFQILERDHLEHSACECYKTVRDQFNWLLT